MSETNLIQRADAHVYDLLLKQLDHSFVFHNYDHAQEVSEVAGELAAAAELPASSQEALVLAAWFHDTGYIVSRTDHFAASARLASEFLEREKADPKLREQVPKLIKSLEAQQPEGGLSALLHDANISYLGRKRFERRSNLLRLEEEHHRGKTFTLIEWQERMLERLVQTRYHSQEAHEEFSKRLNKNLASLKEDLRKGQRAAIRKKTGKDFGRGVDTIYRVTLRNHMNLSSIADGKANMIISINTLVLSILITAASAGFSMTNIGQSGNLKFAIPIIVLMVTSLTAIIFGVLSAIPKVSGQEFSLEDVRKHKVSILYFGNFLKIGKGEFVDYLRELKEDQEILYDDLSRDLYNLGAVLRKKYRLLSIAYRVFVGGLALSVLTFLITFFVL
jgi:predicted metal-dependent HD superfamily phosphohydrolase